MAIKQVPVIDAAEATQSINYNEADGGLNQIVELAGNGNVRVAGQNRPLASVTNLVLPAGITEVDFPSGVGNTLSLGEATSFYLHINAGAAAPNLRVDTRFLRALGAGMAREEIIANRGDISTATTSVFGPLEALSERIRIRITNSGGEITLPYLAVFASQVPVDGVIRQTLRNIEEAAQREPLVKESFDIPELRSATTTAGASLAVREGDDVLARYRRIQIVATSTLDVPVFLSLGVPGVRPVVWTGAGWEELDWVRLDGNGLPYLLNSYFSILNHAPFADVRIRYRLDEAPTEGALSAYLIGER